MKEKILNIIDNIRRILSFIQKMIVKNNDFTKLGLTLRKEINKFNYILASKTWYQKNRGNLLIHRLFKN